MAALVTIEPLPEPEPEPDPAETVGEEPVERGTEGTVLVAAASTLEVLAGRAWAELVGESPKEAVTGQMVV